MPANWGTFISNVTQTIAGQAFTNPGSIANDPPRIGAGAPPYLGAEAAAPNPNFGVPYTPLVTPSGRRDWGESLAAEYIAAIKTAQTPIGATRFVNAAADKAFTIAYGEVFERLYKDGDLNLIDTKDEDGNIIKEGKESSEAFADLCPDPIEVPDPIEEEKKRKKKFNEFIEKEKDRQGGWKLHKFMFSEFHCIEDNQPQAEVEKLIATKLIREFEAITSNTEKIKYYDWILRLGSLYYIGESVNWYIPQFVNNLTIGDYPFFNVNIAARQDIEDAGYVWQDMVNNVSQLVMDSILISYPVYTDRKLTGYDNVYNSLGHYTGRTPVYGDVVVENIYKRIQAGIKSEMITPWPYTDPEKQECPLSKYKIQTSYSVDDQRPKLLTNEVIALFSYTDRRSVFIGGNIWTSESNGYLKHIYYDKRSDWVENNYKEIEYKVKWLGTPSGLSGNNSLGVLNVKRNSVNAGTLYKFIIQLAIDAKKAADKCDANEVCPEIDFDYACGDPYEELAQATITYWYSHLTQPFKATPPMPSAVSTAPLSGIYIPIYYGSKIRLAKGLRRALNSSKSFNKLPATEPPAAIIATALAAVYALHLLEFKLIYLGGVPVPTVPFVPMVGFVPVVF